MLSKTIHHIRRYLYKKTHRMLPELNGGEGACGQDMLIHSLVGNKVGGVFVDIGAHDGVSRSNSYYFEKNMGWSGLAIEPIPGKFEELKKNRRCEVINGCITGVSGKAKFLEVVGSANMLSTLAINNIGLTERRLRKSAKRNNCSIREIEVECYNPNDLFKEKGVTSIDFLSVDTEGGELDIIKSIDFSKTPVKVISVENNYFKSGMQNYLISIGFLYLGTFNVDEIYIFGGEKLREAIKDQMPS
ncbi:MAG: FkbM family methyltransferase [Candidatus Endobugula sp.]|jgi:FkbM family methyltransferase